MQDLYDKIMKSCFKLALKGRGFVKTNPLVGCIIINEGKIIGKGFHSKYGAPHAEIEAINNAKSKGFSLKGSSLYVNLEPCVHYGKTPPCTDAIIKEGIKEVIIGCSDPNPEVNGKGINTLLKKGIKVRSGILQNESESLNKFFFTNIKKKRPYITLKIAQTLDGIIALSNFKSKYITSEDSRLFVYKLRTLYDAVLIGKNTAKFDNPKLTVRSIKGKNPNRYIIDPYNSLKHNLILFNDFNRNNTTVINKGFMAGQKRIEGINYVSIKSKNIIPLKKITDIILKQKNSSLLVEGGAFIFSLFLKENLFDDLYVIIAPKILGKGLNAFNGFSVNKLDKAKKLKFISIVSKKNDLILYYKNT